MEREGELIQIPENVQSPMSIEITADPFWNSFEDACEYYEAHPRGVQNTVLWFGHQLVTLQENERFVLRDTMGFERTVDLMDEKFTYEGPIIGKKPAQKLYVKYPQESRDLYMEYANNNHIGLEELTARMHLMGLYVLEQLREEGVNILKITDGEREFWNIKVPHQRHFVRSRLERYYEGRQYRNDSKNGFQKYSDWPSIDQAL